MTWAKLSDDYSDDTWTLSDAAFRLHTEGLVWSNRKLLDCVLEKDDLRRFAKNPDAVGELLDAGFWQESGTCYIIRHHAQYQRTREAVIAQQEANLANGKKGGRPPKPKPIQKTQPVTDSVTKPVAESPNPSAIDPNAWKPEEFAKSRVITGRETQPVTESLTESETKRDRTGQAFKASTPKTRDFPDCANGCGGRLNQRQVEKGSAICLNCEHLASISRVPETV
ncbi:hypothetical protein [Arthrobacter sp. FW306-2-2C-D06B]|uniref:hypothetical protein n=1 Tax=Arthrobacter sp. FW306-2-2C-D06B TaxID=2879618 RepID=UPI001F452E92|nr:hypothetical protein [Arthrobacter sp. FW306-2-2C-D06B]UKA57517.1 hypothetical protein LFT47_14605 [Arthrobacter sp. FW306-2-2C-D06B]